MAAGQDTHPVRAAREKLGLRQADVAEKAGCSVPLISAVEHNYRPPPATQQAIAAAVAASAGSFW